MTAYLKVIAALAVSLWSARAMADPPVLSYSVPAAVAPGKTLDVTFHGEKLSAPSGLWTSFSATAQPASAPPAKGPVTSVTYRITVPEDTPLGIGGVRVGTAEGISNVRLLAVDDLASTVDAADNHRPDKAQSITVPIAVDGSCQAEQDEYFKFQASAGERVSIEVLAHRLGSPLDPVVRVLDSKGNELAYADDDPATGADSRLIYQFANAGEYTVELRDIRYQGGDAYRYRLRIGEFPLVTAPYPLAAKRGALTSVGFVGQALDGVMSVTVAPGEEAPFGLMSLRATYPSGRGSTWASLMTAAAQDQLEQEPNDASQSSTPCRVPGAIEGRLERPGDRDFFYFSAKKGDRITFTGQTRSLGSPADVLLRLYRADGAMMAEVEDSGGEEGQFTHRFPADGVYRLRVEDVNGRGGPDFVYRITAETPRPGFSLSIDTELFVVPQGGDFVANVSCTRRDYTGPIKISVEGAGEGLRVLGDEIHAGKNGTVLRVTLPAQMKAGTIASIAIVGKAVDKGVSMSARASTRPLLRRSLKGLAYPPVALDGAIGLGVAGPMPKFFDLALTDAKAFLPQPGRPARLRIAAKRMIDFKDRVDLVLSGLPEGVTVKNAAIEKGQNEAAIELTAAKPLEDKLLPLSVLGKAEFKHQKQEVKLAGLELHPAPPLQVALETQGTLPIGGEKKALLRFVGMLGKPPVPAHYDAAVALAAEGPRAPAQPGLEADNRAANFAGMQKTGGALRAEPLELSTDYTVEFWMLHGAAARQSGRPISGYVFSRGALGGAPGAGDHLGIGGTMPTTPRDRLFIYNGRSILAGRTELPPDTWHHVVYVRSGEAVSLYLDGNVTAPEIKNTLGAVDRMGPLVFGTRSDGYAPFEGRLDELAVYNGSLSPERIAAHYAAATKPDGAYAAATKDSPYPAKVLEDNPLAYWRLNETDGRIARNAAAARQSRVVELKWKNLPAGLTAPSQVTLAGGKNTADILLSTTPQTVAGKFPGVSVAATIKVDGRPLTVESPPLLVEVTRP